MRKPSVLAVACSILLLLMSLSSRAVLSAQWTNGLDIFIIVCADDLQGLNELRPHLNHFLGLVQEDDQVTIVLDDESQLVLDDNTCDWSALTTAVTQRGPSRPLNEVLTDVQSTLENKTRPGHRPLTLILDHNGLDPSTEGLEATLVKLRKHEWLVAGLAAGPLGSLEQLAKLGVGPTYVPENGAAWDRALAEIVTEARRSPRLAIAETYIPVDPSCQQLTLLLNGTGELQIAHPDGSVLTADEEDVVWSQGPGTATVTIPAPEPGHWRVLGDGWSGQGVLTSAVRLTTIPILSSYPTGEVITLVAYLADGDRVVVDAAARIEAELLGPSQETLKMPLYDDGKHGDGANRDGLYGTQLQLNIPGPYQVHYEARRGTLQRTTAASFTIGEPNGMERRYSLSPDRIDLPKLVPGRTYQQTLTLTSHLPKAETFQFQMGEDGVDLRSFGQLIISPREIQLGPGETRTITLSIRLQPQAPLGRYAGHLSLVPASSSQRGQIVPLRLGVVPWPIAHWQWLACSGAGVLLSFFAVALSLARPQLRGSLSSFHVGGREQLPLHGHRFLLSPTSHRSCLIAVRRQSRVTVYLQVHRHDPPVLLNGEPVTGRCPLHPGDQLRLGRVIWEYRDV